MTSANVNLFNQFPRKKTHTHSHTRTPIQRPSRVAHAHAECKREFCLKVG